MHSFLFPKPQVACVAAWAACVLLLGACSGGDDSPTDPTPPPAGVNQPPVAALSLSARSGPAPLSVTFDGSGSRDPDGEIVSWAWAFGDGSTGSGRVVTHRYAGPGHYFPRLTVTDARGASAGVGDSVLVVAGPLGAGPGVVEGTVWLDEGGSGSAAVGGTGVAGVPVVLDLDGDGRRGSGEPWTVTDAAGRYRFEGVSTAASAAVTIEPGLGWTPTWAGEPATSASPSAPAASASGAGTAPGSIPAQVIGGTTAAEGEFPFMVTLLRAEVSSPVDAFTCGGTLIASRWVLTAAHCVVPGAPADFEVLVGTNRLGAGGERVAVKEVIVYPTYGAFSFVGNDIALLELDRAFLRPRIELLTPGRLHLSAPGRPAVALGWGRTLLGGPISTDLRKVSLPLVSMGECEAMLGGNVVDATICAGVRGTTQSICNGDSGGPLMVASGARWVQVGVTSFGTNCQPPAAFARVSEFTDWIRARIPADPAPSVRVEWRGQGQVRVDFALFR